MPQLRRLAISAEDPATLVTFYREVFGLEQIGEAGGSVFLSDGTFNLALLPGEDGAATGLKGLGFETAQVESIRIRLARTANADQRLVERDANTAIEYEMRDPDGNLIGLRTGAFDVSFRPGPVPIRHIALYTPDPRRFLLSGPRHERSRTNGPIIDFRFRRLFEPGALVPAKRRAYRAQSLRLSRQEQRRNANEGGASRRRARCSTAGANSFCGVPGS